MGDGMFASEGDSVDVGRHGPAGWTDRWDDGSSLRTAGGPDDAVAGVALRLQERLDRQLRLADRLRNGSPYAEPDSLPLLVETARRMRHDTDSLLLLCGREPPARPPAPRRLADVLHDAVSVAEEPRRIEIRSAPDASVAAVASVELLHVLAEVVDHVATVYPGTRVDLVSHVEPFGGIMIDVAVDGTAVRREPDGGRRTAAAAEVLAQRSSSGVELRRSPDGPPPSGTAPVASVYCPAGAVTVEETWPTPAPSYPAAADPYRPRTNGNGSDHWSDRRGNGSSHPVTAPPPVHTPSAPSQVDELFGPMIDLPYQPSERSAATPRSSRRSPRPGSGRTPPEPGARTAATARLAGPIDWESPSDVEWRAAAARAAQPRSAAVHRVRAAAPPPGQPAGAAAAQPQQPGRPDQRAGRAGPGPGAQPAEHLPARPAPGPAPRARPGRRSLTPRLVGRSVTGCRA